MSIIRTDLGDTRERARELRFESSAAIAATDVQRAIELVGSQTQPIVSTPVTAADSPYTPAATATYLYVNSSAGPVQIQLQASALRAGRPLVIKDTGGTAATNNITITRSGAETIDGLTNLVINADFGGYRLNPTATGYTVSP